MPDGMVRGVPKRPSVITTGGLYDRVHYPLGNEIWSDEFDDGKIDPAWTRTDASSSSYVVWKEGGNPGYMSAAHNSSASGSGYWHAISVPLPAGATHPLTWETYLNGMALSNANYMMVGLAFTDGLGTSGTNQATFMPYFNSDGALDWILGIRDFDNWNTNVSSWTEARWHNGSSGFYGRLQYTAANSFRFQVSSDGYSWLSGGTRTCTLTPTHVSLITTNWGQTRPYVCGWKYARLYDTLTPESDAGLVDTL